MGKTVKPSFPAQDIYGSRLLAPSVERREVIGNIYEAP
jgi:hypothetical protein